MEVLNEVNFNVVRKITLIAKKLENSQLSDEVIEEIKLHLEDLSNYLDVTINQAVIFSVIFALQVKMYSVDLRDIINFLDIDYIDSLNFKNDIDKLIELSTIEVERENKSKFKRTNMGQADFVIPSNISDSIYANTPIINKVNELLDIYGFAKAVSDYIEQRKTEQIDTDKLFELVEQLEINNEHINPVVKVRTLLNIEDRTLLYEILDDHITGFTSSLEKTLREIYLNNRTRLMKIRDLIEKTNLMYELDYITLGESRFANDFSLNLNSNAIELFMQEDAILFIRNKKFKNVLLNENIVYKELFFDSNLEKEVGFLTNSLMNENFTSLQDRLTNMSLSKGVACIFYGCPGTGKTETVYQVAKKTGRDILLVDISQSKSMWFGESEKRVKEIFEMYKKICSTSEITPILLFNEADAILGTRKENGKSNTQQTENAIQNIILEEMERFEGIMMATTNLAGNLDTAFERRFLFKIKFENPTVEAKTKIWQSKLSWLSSDFTQKLSTDFSLSGGEIDNIVRKVTMNEVLTGERPELDDIYGYCQNEKAFSNNGKARVGYV